MCADRSQVMTSTAPEVATVLAGAHDEILDRAALALDRSHLPHYDNSGPAEQRVRLGKLFDVVVDCLRARQLIAVVTWSEQIARERFESGFGIGEVQTAFNVLEESMWRTLVEVTPPSQMAESLGLLTTVLGAGKDALARSYVSLASKQHVPSLDLRALFDGI